MIETLATVGLMPKHSNRLTVFLKPQRLRRYSFFSGISLEREMELGVRSQELGV